VAGVVAACLDSYLAFAFCDRSSANLFRASSLDLAPAAKRKRSIAGCFSGGFGFLFPVVLAFGGSRGIQRVEPITRKVLRVIGFSVAMAT
jgi:hypothetical protein